MTQQLERLSFPRKEFPFVFDELRAQQRKGFLAGRPGIWGAGGIPAVSGGCD